MNNVFSIITAEVVSTIVAQSPDNIYEAVKNAYIQHGKGQASNPPSYFLSFPDQARSRIIALPALIMQNPRIAGIKWISSNPDNLRHNLKRASAVIILNDYDTGYPIACLEGSIISALRTVYSAILVSEHLLDTKNTKQTLGIVGTGNLSEQFVKSCSDQNWMIEKIVLFDLDDNAPKRLQEKIHKINSTINVALAQNLEELITQSSLIFLSTTSSTPYISELSWFAHNPIVLNISLRDLAPEILIASNNIVDNIEHVLNANTSPYLAQQKYGHSNFINCTVPELIGGYNKFDHTKPTIFSPMGMGILDLAVASYIYDKAKQTNLAIEINNFFGS
jgi:N-[(2S)-2-amino-2-carboxyethyl]-L-glutamate dehydrogenase